MLLEKLETPSHWRGTRVRIPWSRGGHLTMWNETCAWAMEEYGLPGTLYTCNLTPDYIDFHFHKEEHAVHFSLRWL